MYKIEFDGLDDWIQENSIRRVLVQVPLGLRPQIPLVVKHLKERNVEPIISTGKCWGACDLAYGEARAVGADGVIHLGHAKFTISEEIPTFYIECRVASSEPLLEMVDVVSEAIGKNKVVGIGATIQWIEHLDLFTKKLEERGITALTGKRGPRTPYRGQVIGCDYTCIWSVIDRVDCSLVIGSVFHGIGASLTTPKPVYVVDPELRKIREVNSEVEELLKRRYAWIELFKNARRVGVLIGVKPGQRKIDSAIRMKNILEDNGKEADFLTVDELNADQLDNLPYDGYVNTACPRLSIEDQIKFRLPLLLPSEVLIACGKLKWENTIYSTRYLIS